jgi:hypothetical protein
MRAETTTGLGVKAYRGGSNYYGKGSQTARDARQALGLSAPRPLSR